MATLSRLFIKVESTCCRYPVAVFQCAVVLFSGALSFQGLLSVALAFFTADAIFRIQLARHDLAVWREIQQFLAAMPPGTHYVSTPLDDYKDGALLRKIKGDRHFWAYGNDAVRERVIRNVELYRVVGAKKAYRSFAFRVGAKIFLPDDPNDLKGAARFYFLHELGHSTVLSNFYSIRSGLYYVPFMAVSLYGIFQIDLDFYPFVGFVVFGLALLAIEFISFGHRYESGLRHEIMADCFALSLLEEPDRASAKRVFGKYPMKNDALLPEFSEIRRKYLIDNLQLLEDGEEKVAYPRITHPITVYWTMILATMVFAAFMNDVAQFTLLSQAGISVGVTVLQLFFVLETRVLKARVDRWLAAGADAGGRTPLEAYS